MQRHPVRHFSQSALFLMELILAVAFLSLSSVVCIRLYLYAHTLSEASLARTQAVRESQNIGSSWLSSDGSLADTLSLYLETTNPVEDQMVPEEADSFVLYYNSDWELLPSSLHGQPWPSCLRQQLQHQRALPCALQDLRR